MTGPTEPRSGRHATPESGTGAGRSAAELLAAWASAGTTVVEPRTGRDTGT
ncbi:MAG: Endolytic murein transglycosylase, partial [Modestobacter sp.]|nr:Endolytic murein transglycosylase [Modestobacter sp.]